MNPRQLVQNHPAETAGPAAMALAALIAKLFDITDADTIVYLALVLSFVPAAVTWLVINVMGRKPKESNDSAGTTSE